LLYGWRDTSFLPQLDDVLARCALSILCDFADKRWRNVPPLSVVGYDGDRLAVVPRKHASHLAATGWLKCDPITDLELQHLGVRVHLRQEPQPFHDAIVEIDELSLGKAVDVNGHANPPHRIVMYLMSPYNKK
jgi:hypothetical protein